MRPLLCVTVMAATTADLRRQRDGVSDADLVELRLDSVSDPNVAGALAGRRRPVIVTCRPTWEGGQFTGSEEERRRLLADALALGAEYVDVEWRAGFDDLIAQAGGRRIVLSMHDYTAMPKKLGESARAMRATGAEVIKIAGTAKRLSDCLPLLELGSASDQQRGQVLIAMGEAGLVTRVLAGRFASSWTYAGALAGVGQLGAATMLEEYRFRAITESTDLYGVVGSPVAHSLSPAMYNAAFRAVRLDAVYLPLHAADADDFMTFAPAIGLKGASVTIPFNVVLYDRVDEAYAVARRAGAINTVRIVDGRWLGGNTDASGFLRPLKDRNVPLRGLRTAILGAGGAARAVAIALASCGVDLTVHARDQAGAAQVALIASGRAGPWPPQAGSWDLLVNCTPIGTNPHADRSPVEAAALTGRLVYDLVCHPKSTRLLREAAAAGCQTIGGIEMLVAQAHEQFEWWTNVRPPTGVMRAAAERRLAECSTDEYHVA